MAGWSGLYSVLANLQDSKLDVLVGRTLVIALKDHHLMVLRAYPLLPGYFKHEADQFVRVLDQVRRHLVPDHASACVDLPHGV